ncbi:telomerase protein component 1-like isoform X2 [Sinocyclocheilus rhinocerous]|nr:PREDICTED: telomerase protein component 1-like isoform X2 [Sinocyclocheilus rhinocerous]XP_016365538.1 PREDICTED: telomerase protein component 1-like isoform X2 [Sinocyclocheilus rhinocerous]XP_016365539.1 PREDICTED: telomerase protein component 1-like isoform X2 [Sinocyclocheilus rhinocerous]
MKTPASLQTDLKANTDSRLQRNYSSPRLENCFLAQSPSALCHHQYTSPSWAKQTSTSSSCPALQPTSLSSTMSTSSLLSSTTMSSLSSPSSLLSTKNTLLMEPSLHPPVSSSLTSSYSHNPLLSCSKMSTPSAAPAVCSYPPPSMENKSGSNEKREVEDMLFSPEGLLGSSEEPRQDARHESLEEDDQMLSSEVPVLNMDLDGEREQTVAPQEEFGVIEASEDEQLVELRERKHNLLNMVCCSLVNKSCTPGQKDWDKKRSVWAIIKVLATEITTEDPEFLLKVAVYTRQELNIRITANFLLALAAHLPGSKPHLRRYFCAAVQLPSDWLEVTRIYSMCFNKSLPSCLKKALVDKFKQFTEYQMAKYNTRKHRCKHNKKRKKGEKISAAQWKKWGDLVRVDISILKKYLESQNRTAKDKKQSEFSLKKMIKRLHIKEPAEHVMAILGKKYPSDLKAFSRSGLSGVWERERAGKRIKLKQPDTWECKLSQEGNKASTWEKLIDGKSLPFMAMLRNLRNMISVGISENHHTKILNRLTSKNAVIKSRQFPFRFLSAYKVILELSKFAGGPAVKVPSSREILQGVLKKLPKSKRFRQCNWETTPRKRLRATMRVPFVYRIFNAKRNLLKKANQRLYTRELLNKYCCALEKALQISCKYNIPPLPGRTLVICDADNSEDRDWSGADDVCLPPESTEDTDENKLSASVQEAAMLLSMMINYCSEDSQVMLLGDEGLQEFKVKSEVLLDNVRQAMKQVKDLNDYDVQPECISSTTFFTKLSEEKTKLDRIVVCENDCINRDLIVAINNYRQDINRDAVVIRVRLGNMKMDTLKYKLNSNTVELWGFSEQILKFVSERGSSRMLQHVEHMDRVYNIPPPQGRKTEPERAADVISLPPTLKFRWKSVRVFISSTFRDMHAERDVLVRSVFPELRRRAAPHYLYLQEVELRWGVTEEESNRAVELCLSEVCRSQLLLGILGERYGLVPPRPTLPELPQYSWLNSASNGLSITEMEIRQFQALYPDTAQSRMFFYFRSPRLASSVPVAWRTDFVAESKEAEAKMNSLKTWIRNSDFKVTENYPCEWGGVVDGKPYLKCLEDFGRAALENIWEAIQQLFVEETDEDVASEIEEQEVHQHAQQRQFHGRAKLISVATEKVQECQQKGGILMVEGNPGEGKTVFMAALAQALKTSVKNKKAPLCDVISYSTDASQSACNIEQLLRCLVQWLRKRKDDVELPPNTSYKDLLSEFHLNLNDLSKKKPLALLVDGADRVHDGRGQRLSEWIPQHIPKGVCLVLSVTSESSLQNIISKRKSTVSFPLGQLSLPDKKEIVQKQLVEFGKKLSDSAFNNQLQTLLMKKGSVSPLYLHLACEELRNYASFEKMKHSLQSLPQSLGELVQHSLLRLQNEYCRAGLGWALATLAISSTGLRESSLYTILNMCNDLNSRGGLVTWQEILHVARHPESRVPMAIFSQLARTLHSVIGPSHGQGSDELLILTHPEVMSAFEHLYLSTEESRTRSHLIIAAHLWVQSNPQGKDTFLHSDADILSQLPAHLMGSNQWEPLCFLLSSYYFLYANVRHGLLHQLLETYILFAQKYETHQLQSKRSTDNMKDCEDCLSFLKRHSLLFSQWPALFVQTALNEPCDSSAHLWAESMTRNGGVHAVKWLNCADAAQKEASELVSTFHAEPSCVEVSPDGKLVAVGTVEGTLHFLHTETGQQVKSLMSSGDGISGCVFLGEELLATTSFDGQVEVWDVASGCRTAHMYAHSNKITGCGVSPDKKLFATVSLDLNLKVWSAQKSTEVASLMNPSPLNCVNFDLEGQLVAVGCWDGAVRLWNWLEQKNIMTLLGHQSSVRSLSFSPCSSMLCSGCLSGEVRLWSVTAAACVGSYHAHRGSTQSLNFLQGGSLLMSAGHDSVVHVWSGGLGQTIAVLGEEKIPSLQQQKRSRHGNEDEANALCVAVASGYAAVGYHGNGIKMFNLKSGEKVWSSEDLQVSMLCLIWMEAKGTELLLSGGMDHNLRVWERQGENPENLVLIGYFGVQKGPILFLAQNATCVASASDDFTIALWLKNTLTSKPWIDPKVMCILRGHIGGVTCLAFSPNGKELLSGGKDQALMIWKVNTSPPVLSQSISNCHGDWITGCAWTSSAVLSCSSDCKLRMWDIQTGCLLREILSSSSLNTLCCWEDHVIAGSTDGLLMVWKWESGIEIARIQAHKSRLHHCTVVFQPDLEKNVKPEDLLVASASEDGTVKLWHPLKVQHHNTLHGHSAEIQALVSKDARLLEFLTVSADRSLRSWNVTTAMETPRCQKGSVSSVCFLGTDELMVCGYDAGRLEIWHQNSVVYWKKVSDGVLHTVTGMLDDELAVGCSDCSVCIWKLERDSKKCIVGLDKVSSFKVEPPVSFLFYCGSLFGVCMDGKVINMISTNDHIKEAYTWANEVRPLGVMANDNKSFWLLGQKKGILYLGLILSLNPSGSHFITFCEDAVGKRLEDLETEEEEKQQQEEEKQQEEEQQQQQQEKEEEQQQQKKLSEEQQRERQAAIQRAAQISTWITAAAVQNDFFVCGDCKGNMWFNQPPNLSTWTQRKPAHTDKVSVLRLTESLIISASYDRTVKLWDRRTKKQVGMFMCGGPVKVLEVNPCDPKEFVCADTQGQLYFLSWKG